MSTKSSRFSGLLFPILYTRYGGSGKPSSPFVFSGATVLELANVDDRAPHVDVTCDGTEPIPLFLGERLVIRRSPKTLKMLKIKHAGFFSVLNAKLSEYELKN